MIDVSFEIGGRKVRPNQMADALEEAVLANLSESISKSLRSVHCAEHGERPKVKCKGRKLDNLTFEISGCCENLIEQAKNRLS